MIIYCWDDIMFPVLPCFPSFLFYYGHKAQGEALRGTPFPLPVRRSPALGNTPKGKPFSPVSLLLLVWVSDDEATDSLTF